MSKSLKVEIVTETGSVWIGLISPQNLLSLVVSADRLSDKSVEED